MDVGFLVNVVVPSTNRFAEINKIRGWRALTPDGALEYVSLLLYMGIVRRAGGPAEYFQAGSRDKESCFFDPFVAGLHHITSVDRFRQVRS